MAAVPIEGVAQLGAVVRAARESRALAQHALAEQAGVARQWLVLLETGRLRNPTLHKILAVLHALDLELLVGARDLRQEMDLDQLMGQ